MTNKHYEVKQVSSLTEAMDLLLGLRHDGYWSFRGQRLEKWTLGLHDLDLTTLDDKLSQFRRRCMEFPRQDYIEEFDEWRWMFFAQHYRLKTRLIDWTSNPLVALYFAVENILSRKNDTDDYGAVWALQVHKDNFKTPKEIDKAPPDVENWLMVNPPPVTHRIARQSGKFSYHPSLDSNGDLPQISHIERRDGECLRKIEIVSGNGKNPTAEIRQQLGIMNIHHAALFHDPDGVAEFVNYEWPIYS